MVSTTVGKLSPSNLEELPEAGSFFIKSAISQKDKKGREFLRVVYRMIDANINRTSEGLRVLEDLARFCFNHSELNEEVKKLRHRVRKTIKPIEEQLLAARDAANDPGLAISQNNDLDNKLSLEQLLAGNSKRAQEGLRVIEESLKIIGQYNLSKIYERLRYETYTLEKKFFNLLKENFADKGE